MRSSFSVVASVVAGPLTRALGAIGAEVKRDLDLIRKLVLAVEEKPSGTTPDIQIDGFTPEQIGYHSYLLADSGLAKGVDVSTSGDTLPNWKILHLTSAEHDFADAARSESTWNKATTIVKDEAGGITLDVMKQLLISVVKNTLGL